VSWTEGQIDTRLKLVTERGERGSASSPHCEHIDEADDFMRPMTVEAKSDIEIDCSLTSKCERSGEQAQCNISQPEQLVRVHRHSIL